MRTMVLIAGGLLCGCLGLASGETVPLVPILRSSLEPAPSPQAFEGMPAGETSAPMETENRKVVHFTFAVPDYDSRISLGVFDANDRLIRTIASSKPEAGFQIGLNGLIAEWDWKDEEGAPVPNGEYFIYGFAVGDFEETGRVGIPISWGDAFGEGLDIRQIQQLGLGANGILFILGVDSTDRPVLIAYDPANDARIWSRTLGQNPGENWILGQPSDPVLAVMGNGELEIIDHQTGTVLLRGKVAARGEKVHSLRYATRELQWVTDAGVQRVSMEDLAPLEPLRGLPGELVRFHEDASGRIALDKDGRLWVENPGWFIYLHQDGAWFDDFVAGGEGRFWALVRERRDGEQRLGQLNAGGEFLRQIHPGTFEGIPSIFTAGNDESTLFVLSKDAENQDRQLLGIRRIVLDGHSSWETFWEKRLNPLELLIKDGFRQLPLRMQLEVTSALGQGREAGAFRLLIDLDGIQLATPGGLKIGELWRGTDIRAAAAAASKDDPRTLQFRVVRDGMIEEGKTSGLDRIARIDAGRFVWPPEEE